MTTRHVRDRLLLLLLGGGLVAAGLALVDWQQAWVLSWSDRIETDTVSAWSTRGWWPWAQAGAGAIVALLGLAWLGAHRPRRGPRTVPAGPGETSGRVEADLPSLGDALGAQLEASGTVDGSRASFARTDGRVVCALDARLTPGTDLDTLVAAVEEAAVDLARAVPGADLALQVRCSGPRPSRTPRARRNAVRLA